VLGLIHVDFTPTMHYPDIKVGSTLLFKDEFPCRVKELSTCKPGKHGEAKKVCIGIDVLTGKKHEASFTHKSLLTPVTIHRQRLTVVDVSADGYVSTLSDDAAGLRHDLAAPEGLVADGPTPDEIVLVTVAWGPDRKHEHLELV